ncbi:MAG: cytochrome b [Pseudomonadota bacterium]
MPALVARDCEVFASWQQVHEFMAWTLLAPVAIRVAAALKHHGVDHDGVLPRMLPRRAPRRKPEGAGS